ncbi:MAG: hypothetical protein PHR26_03845 [Candidatus ainarchaeum sp.]|nr:hypothetical protein [Candidatus ainarchaeum sp.]MDD3975866.1 hypothetical protein [Candidatus ainarchaeum sp.]
MDQKILFIILLGFIFGFLICFFIFIQVSNLGYSSKIISNNLDYINNSNLYKIEINNKNIFIENNYIEEFLNNLNLQENALKKSKNNNIILERCKCVLTKDDIIYIMETCDCGSNSCQEINAICKDSISVD